MSATNDSPERKEPKVKVDEEWKARVKAEDEALDRAREEQKKAAQAGPATEQLPPADFATLVSMLSTQAMVALGVLPDPTSQKTEVRLPVARHFIDLLGVLEEKTKGNLNETERRLLDETLHQLRLAFVERTREVSQTA